MPWCSRYILLYRWIKQHAEQPRDPATGVSAVEVFFVVASARDVTAVTATTRCCICNRHGASPIPRRCRISFGLVMQLWPEQSGALLSIYGALPIFGFVPLSI